jgi:Ca2+-binding EF-hand superfamily protein
MGQLMALFSNAAELKKLREDCPLSEEELEMFRMETGFALKEILRYYAVFKEYVSCLAEHKETSKVELTPEEFQGIPCIAISPLKAQYIKCIPSRTGSGRHQGNVDFAAFLRLLAVTNGDSRTADRLRFAFNMYDLDGDGKVSIKDMTAFIMAVTDFAAQDRGEQAKAKEMLDNAVKQMFKELGREEYLRLEDFAQTLVHTDFAHKYTLHISTKVKPKKMQVLIDKTTNDLEADAERVKKDEERRQQLWELSEEGKAEIKEKQEEEEAKKKKEEEEAAEKKKEEEEEAKKKKEEEEAKKKKEEEEAAAKKKQEEEAAAAAAAAAAGTAAAEEEYYGEEGEGEGEYGEDEYDY